MNKSLLMHDHVIGLCANHGIIYSWCKRPIDAWASNDLEEICIPPITSRRSYATALHEIGHILGRHQSSKHAIVRERWAWEWAMCNALFWTSTMDQYADRSLSFAARVASK